MNVADGLTRSFHGNDKLLPEQKTIKKDHDFGSSVLKSGLTPRATVLVNVSDHHHVVSERKSGAKFAVEYTFIQNRFIQMIQIPKIVHPGTHAPENISSKNRFVQKLIRPKHCRGVSGPRQSG